jgi:hypothetical protein
MQDWPDANSWIANPETLLNDLEKLSEGFDEVMMRGPSTSRTLDMGQVELNWANFVTTARRFSRRLRAVQARVSFPVDANAIIRVADIVDELNYGPQRWQTSTDGSDREHTTMEFKELYFEPYVMCHRIFVDAISTFREYLSLHERANPEAPVKDKSCIEDLVTAVKTADELESQSEEDVRSKGIQNGNEPSVAPRPIESTLTQLVSKQTLIEATVFSPKVTESNFERHRKPNVRRNAVRDSQWHDWRHIDGLTDAQIRDRWDRENPDNRVSRDNAENGLGVVASAIKREESRRRPGTG